MSLLQQFAGMFQSGVAAEPFKKLASMTTPAIEMFGAAVGYNTFYGDAFPHGMSLKDRLLQTAEGYSPQLTMYKRLTGDGSGLYNYTPEEAISAGAVLGSIQPKGLNQKKATLDAIKFGREMTGEKAPKPLSAHKSLLKWAEKNKGRFNADALDDLKKWEQAEHMVHDARIKLAKELGLMRDSDPSKPSVEKLTKRQEYAIRIGVLHKLRPDVLAPNYREMYKQTWEKGTAKEIEKYAQLYQRYAGIFR